jgi:carbamoyltransferase
MIPTLAIYGIQDRSAFAHPGYTHDHNLCLMENGEVKTYLHLERWSRRKYDNRMSIFLEELIAEGQLELPDQFELVMVNSFVGNAFVSKSGRLRFETEAPVAVKPHLTPARAWWEVKDWEGGLLPAWAISHELAHVASTLPFYGDWQDDSLLVHFDGGASRGNFSAYLLRKGKLELVECHWELSQLSKFFNDNALAFALVGAQPGEHCSVAGKLMGYATLGEYHPEIGTWMRQHQYFRHIWDDWSIFNRKARKTFGWKGSLKENKDPFLMSVAAVFQHDFTQLFLHHLEKIQRKLNVRFLYFTGGCALNIVTNRKLLQKGWFEEVFIPPACNDSGLALGAAAFREREKGICIKTHSPFLNNLGLREKVASQTWTTDFLDEICQLLLQRKVLGLFLGKGEAGPRALGHRSLIALADSKALADRISIEIKGREWYRPLAPVMLEKNVREVTGMATIPQIADFMLVDFSILPDFHSVMEGVIHRGYARIQSIRNRSFHPFLFDLLARLDEKYGVKALINTSFNRRGAPIVHTESQAIEAGWQMGVDALILNGHLEILKNCHR